MDWRDLFGGVNKQAALDTGEATTGAAGHPWNKDEMDSDMFKTFGNMFGGGDDLEPGYVPLPAGVQEAQDLGRGYQLQGAKNLTNLFSQNPTQLARAQQGREISGVQDATQSSMQRLRDLTQRRGLGNSSLGLSQEIGLKRQASKDIGQIRASLPDRIRELRQQQATGVMGVGSQILGQPGYIPQYFQGQESQGGILPLIGTGVGAYLGSAAGPAGTLAGAQIGAGTGQYASSMF